MSLFAGADLKSTTLPGAILELVQKAQIAEQGLATPKNNINLAINGDGTAASISITLPVSMVPDATTGKLSVTATDYIV